MKLIIQISILLCLCRTTQAQISDSHWSFYFSCLRPLPPSVPPPMDTTFLYDRTRATPELQDGYDPGRNRPTQLFKQVYGRDESNVEKNLVEVVFLNQIVRFNKNMGAANSLEKVGMELIDKSRFDKDLADFLEPFRNGELDLDQMTFKWRKIKGSDDLSPHSFAIAIDLFNPELIGNSYWHWQATKERAEKFGKGLPPLEESQVQNFKPSDQVRIPASLVEAFENNGFIWGGRWFHYDIMHFEFRPEFFSNYHGVCSSEVKTVTWLDRLSLLIERKRLRLNALAKKWLSKD